MQHSEVQARTTKHSGNSSAYRNGGDGIPCLLRSRMTRKGKTTVSKTHFVINRRNSTVPKRRSHVDNPYSVPMSGRYSFRARCCKLHIFIDALIYTVSRSRMQWETLVRTSYMCELQSEKQYRTRNIIISDISLQQYMNFYVFEHTARSGVLVSTKPRHASCILHLASCITLRDSRKTRLVKFLEPVCWRRHCCCGIPLVAFVSASYVGHYKSAQSHPTWNCGLEALIGSGPPTLSVAHLSGGRVGRWLSIRENREPLSSCGETHNWDSRLSCISYNFRVILS